MAQTYGLVSATSLNVRPEPSTAKPALGALKRGTKVEILEKLEGWYRIRSGSLSGYVSGDYVTIVDSTPAADYLWEMDQLRTAQLAPPEGKAIPVLAKHNASQKMAAKVWNGQGGLLEILSGIIEVEPAAAVAVLCVESGGAGFDANNRMIIRFENHIFWNLWGKKNPDTFNTHFTFNSQKKWLGHKFRKDANSAWLDFHGKQDNEWQVFDFARTLSENAAMNAISMGGPQVMGFNCSQLGYDSVQEMFANFSSDIRYQVLGLFDFLRGHGSTSAMIEALQLKDYTRFASYYNGSGQAPVYGSRIESYVQAFKSLKS
ncbi:bacterial SH3 domain protein [Geobacter sp. OR-1]|uniref:N-acetylmuramidase domain-containing protein n=1 Tax=Geobacter sp. OR-1 TaxID=1266765 RepID=UPI0005440FE0|nr:N-acetylmuramidase domain-containing protein [Geobacter sp. OR-1]GAM10159.1 bacterial SH3 domain protein [Geobacter sp. OR-1]